MTVRVDIATACLPPGFAIERDAKSGRRVWVCQECGMHFRPTERGARLMKNHERTEHHTSAVRRNERVRRGVALGYELAHEGWYRWLDEHTTADLRRPDPGAALTVDEIEDIAERLTDAAPDTAGLDRQPTAWLTRYFDGIRADLLASVRHTVRALRLCRDHGLPWHLAIARTKAP